MPRGLMFLLVLLLVLGGLLYLLSTQAEPVPQTVIEANVDAATQ